MRGQCRKFVPLPAPDAERKGERAPRRVRDSPLRSRAGRRSQISARLPPARLQVDSGSPGKDEAGEGPSATRRRCVSGRRSRAAPRLPRPPTPRPRERRRGSAGEGPNLPGRPWGAPRPSGPAPRRPRPCLRPCPLRVAARCGVERGGVGCDVAPAPVAKVKEAEPLRESFHRNLNPGEWRTPRPWGLVYRWNYTTSRTHTHTHTTFTIVPKGSLLGFC